MNTRPDHLRRVTIHWMLCVFAVLLWATLSDSIAQQSQIGRGGGGGSATNAQAPSLVLSNLHTYWTRTATNAPTSQFSIVNGTWSLISAASITNPVLYGLSIPGYGATSNYVWTATNSSGLGEWRAQSGGGGSVATNVNQFGASPTLTLANGVRTTNLLDRYGDGSTFTSTYTNLTKTNTLTVTNHWVGPRWTNVNDFAGGTPGWTPTMPALMDTNGWSLLRVRYWMPSNTAAAPLSWGTNELYWGDVRYNGMQFLLADQNDNMAALPAVAFNFNDSAGWIWNMNSVQDFSRAILITNDNYISSEPTAGRVNGNVWWGATQKTNWYRGSTIVLDATQVGTTNANEIRIPGFGATVDHVWTCTNATTGAGKWKIVSGGGGGATNGIQIQGGSGNANTLTNLTSVGWLQVNGPMTNTSGGVMGGDFTFTDNVLYEGYATIGAGAGVFGGLSVDGGLTSTNKVTALGGLGLSGTVTNQVNSGYSGGTNLWIDGGRGTLFSTTVSTGLSNILFTNLFIGQSVDLRVFVNTGSAAGFPQWTTNNTISHKIDALQTNAWNIVRATRLDSTTTNFSLESINFDLVAGTNIAFQTNFVVGTITISAAPSTLEEFTSAAVYPNSNLTNFTADFALAERLIALTNNVHFSAVSNGANWSNTVRYSTFTLTTYGTANRILSFASGITLYGTNNVNLASNKVVTVALKSFGPDITNTVASYYLP